MNGVWMWVTIAGFSIQAPPPECTIGPMVNHSVKYVSAEVLEALKPSTRAEKRSRVYAMTIIGAEYSLVLIDDTLPAPVKEVALEHEYAHLRGCRHENPF